MDDKVLAQTDRTLFASRDYVHHWRGRLYELAKSYYESSGDPVGTPNDVLLDIYANIGKPEFILIVHEAKDKPAGFMIGKIVGDTARIISAFLGPGLDNKSIIRRSLEMFDTWAKANGCLAGDLYTHRHPKSYRSLRQYGWGHHYTVYRKRYSI